MKMRDVWQGMFPGRNSLAIRGGKYLLLVAGVLLLAYVGFVVLDARQFQAVQSRQFQKELEVSKTAASRAQHLLPPSSPFETLKVNGLGSNRQIIFPTEKSTLGRIEISCIGLSAMILEGSDARTLRRAVGHIPGSALPGQQGNVAITGHRDTFFRPLRNIRKDDEITLTTLNGSFHYRVESTRVVEPEDMEALADSDEAVLTLVTCYPFYFVGPAPRRFIVHARLISG